jgi:hypothetical protein
MIVNFRTHRINCNAHKLIQKSTLIIIKKNIDTWEHDEGHPITTGDVLHSHHRN